MKLEFHSVEKEKKKRIIKIIKKKFSKKAKILVLSLSGGRAFGWANKHSDYDIYGIFAAKNYWDSVNASEHGFDINLWKLSDPIYYRSLEFFMDVSNPFYLHPKFDFKGFLKFCTIKTAKEFRGDILRQIKNFEIVKSPKNALHAYGSLMRSIYFLKKKKFELNVFKINRAYKFGQIEKLKIARTQGGKDLDEKEIKRDLAKLLEEYDKLCQKKKEKLDIEEAKKWFEKEKKKFY